MSDPTPGIASRARSLLRSYVADARHGPLPALLLLLTTVSGLIDAASVLSLGRVFVANMTGNIVFIGFGLANTPGFSLATSLSALAGFLVGAVIGGGYVSRFGEHRGVLLRNTTATEFVLLLVALIATAAAGTPLDGRVRDLVASLAAVALGLQNAAVRRLGVPDITTTVVTMTLTAVAAETRRARAAVELRRVLAVVTMLLGALGGALLVLHSSVVWAIAVPAALIGVTALCAALASRRAADWHHATP